MNNKKQPRRGPATDNVAKFTIKEDGTLLAAAAILLPDHKPTKLKSLLRHNQLAVNGVPSTQFDLPVKAGDELWVNFDRSFQVFSHPRIKLIYEDSDIIVIDKGYGVLSTAAGRPSDDTVYNIGLMLLTRTKQARDKLISNWNNMVIERKYIAVVEGKVEQPEGVVKSFLAENPETYEMYSTTDKKLGRLAVTRYQVVKQGKRFAMVELAIKTGRKNQIRVHMRDLGNPVSGDRKYGGHPSPINRIALHATVLSFVHPITGKQVTFNSPVPENFNKMII